MGRVHRRGAVACESTGTCHRSSPHCGWRGWCTEASASAAARLNWWHAAGSGDGRWVAADNWHGDIMLFEGKTTRPHLLTSGHCTYGSGEHPHVGWDRKGEKVIFASHLLGIWMFASPPSRNLGEKALRKRGWLSQRAQVTGTQSAPIDKKAARPGNGSGSCVHSIRSIRLRDKPTG